MEKAENINEADIELIEKAKKLIDLIQTKKNLRNSISSKEIKQLEDALEMVNKKGLQKKVGEDYERAQRLVVKLKGMERMRHEILKLNQPTISEIASYKLPPPHVNMVMKVRFFGLFSQEIQTGLSILWSLKKYFFDNLDTFESSNSLCRIEKKL